MKTTPESVRSLSGLVSWKIRIQSSQRCALVCVLITAVAIAGASLRAGSVYDPYVISTLAGVPPGSADGTGSAARFSFPAGTAVDSAGNIYVADSNNNTIRKITAGGLVSTLAGTAGEAGSVDGSGSAARFYYPQGLACDTDGNVYVADSGNRTIRKITSAGVVTTIAGTAAQFDYPLGVAVDENGNVYVADAGNYTIRKVAAGGLVSTLAGTPGEQGNTDGAGSIARFSLPNGIAYVKGDLYVRDGSGGSYAHVIRKVTLSGVVSTVTSESGVCAPSSVAGDSAGDLFVTCYSSTVDKVTPTGDFTVIAGSEDMPGYVNGTGANARFLSPTAIAADPSGNLFVADENTVRKITHAALVSTFAGEPSTGSSDGRGDAAHFNNPRSVAVDGNHNIYVVDRGNDTIRKITAGGVVSTLAGTAGLTGSADGTSGSARFNYPQFAATDTRGNVFVSDSGNYTIRKVTPAGVVSTFAGMAGAPGNVDGTGSNARFLSPRGIAVDRSNNLYVADLAANTIRKITSAGVVTTLAGMVGSPGSADGVGNNARFDQPTGTGVDSAGNVYVADSANSTIRKITPAGYVSTFAGIAGSRGSSDGTGSTARFKQPDGIAVDNAGNIYVGDSTNYTIRKISPARRVTTLAGSPGVSGYFDGVGSLARFYLPFGVAVDNAGNVYVADAANNTIRAGVPLTPPIITSPSSAMGRVYETFIYQVVATNQPTNYSTSNLPAGLSLNKHFGIISGIPTTLGTKQVTLTATNAAGSGSAMLTLTVQRQSSSNSIVILNDGPETGRSDSAFSYQLLVNGIDSGATFAAQGLPAGLTIDPATGIISGTPSESGSASVVITITDGGESASFTIELNLTADPAYPVITSPGSAMVLPGQPFSYTISAPVSEESENDPPSYSIIGKLPAGLSFDPATGTISGTYNPPATKALQQPNESSASVPARSVLGSVQLLATNSHGTATKTLVFLQGVSQLLNIATRMEVLSGDNVLIGGFIVTGTAPKEVVVRAIGPSLTKVGLSGVLADPVLELHEPDGTVVTNDNWQSSQAAALQGLKLAPADAKESAIVATLKPGAYTAVVSGKSGGTGIGLVEVYDVDPAADSSLGNISSRGFVDTGDNVMIGGVIVGGTNTRVLVRALGPELTTAGVIGALADPTLELHNADGSILASNDNWKDTQRAEIAATKIAPKDNKESAILATLPAGAYTAIVRGKNNTTGVALVEAYNLTP